MVSLSIYIVQLHFYFPYLKSSQVPILEEDETSIEGGPGVFPL